MKKVMLVLAFAGLGLVANAQNDAKVAPAKTDAAAKPAAKPAAKK